jgi:hypothetical protein
MIALPSGGRMGPQPKVLFRGFVTLLFLLVAGCSSTPAQAINDSNQDQTYGIWKVPNPQTPGIQFRAKCNDDITDSQGRTKSEWSFQFRSTYKGTIDFIYLNQAGIAQPPANKMIGPFLDTLKPGEIYENGAELYGGCSQHATLTTGIHVAIKCAVPTGQDAPCFKDANGNPYPQATRSDVQAQTAPAKHAPDPYRYKYCTAGTTDPSKGKQVIITNVFESDLDRDEVTPLFTKWEVRNHPELGNAGDPSLFTMCWSRSTSEAAQKSIDDTVAGEGKSGYSVLMVSWSPK